jgi:hypothetical protein
MSYTDRSELWNTSIPPRSHTCLHCPTALTKHGKIIMTETSARIYKNKAAPPSLAKGNSKLFYVMASCSISLDVSPTYRLLHLLLSIEFSFFTFLCFFKCLWLSRFLHLFIPFFSKWTIVATHVFGGCSYSYSYMFCSINVLSSGALLFVNQESLLFSVM